MAMPVPRPVVAFDVFGTLVDPAGIAESLRPLAGGDAERLAGEWRRVQVEYVFRRAAMGAWRSFAEVTAAALAATAGRFDLDLSPTQSRELVERWWHLPAVPGAAAALEQVKADGGWPVAFSNGDVGAVDALLQRAGLRAALEAVIGVEPAGSYKPAPVVYDYLVTATGGISARTWLVSANAWDAMGARAAGLHSIWIGAGRPAEHWEWSPTATVASLADVPAAIATE